MIGTNRATGWLASIAALVAVVSIGCSMIAPVTRLPTDPRFSDDDPRACAGVGLDAILHGSASDARVAWAIDQTSGGRIDIIWPLGYSARFVPNLEVLDSHGAVVAHEGDLVTGTCSNTLPGPVYIGKHDIAPHP
jgi:hypothetical protein